MMQKLLEDISIPAIFAGFITFLVGISVSAVLVIQAAQILGATSEQISSWFWALGLGIGISGLFLSWKFKYPVATSWSTAGLALIIATGSGYTLYEAIGAFFICGLLTAILGFQAYSKSLVLYSSKSDQCYAGWSITQIWYRAFASLQTNWGLFSLFSRFIYSASAYGHAIVLYSL